MDERPPRGTSYARSASDPIGEESDGSPEKARGNGAFCLKQLSQEAFLMLGGNASRQFGFKLTPNHGFTA